MKTLIDEREIRESERERERDLVDGLAQNFFAVDLAETVANLHETAAVRRASRQQALDIHQAVLAHLGLGFRVEVLGPPLERGRQ